ncbi:heavy metal-associated isoprenylated plant protein 3-like [Actinidia eriantha]|uniref:heavy metal-associated isoprenylated plant protein 3-like n=1 Tax=Actinidia eriantha TaxID=165200 RepID=UPI002584D71F|nr:heavy metal-associated isoprenylated plant protein 3-like [Actinidia eriantha]
MAKKKNKNGSEKTNNDQQPKNENSNEEEKKDDSPITVVLKVQMDCECEGCASRIRKCARDSQGVESVKGLGDSNKLTVVGKVDPVKLREMLEKKAKKKVELVSPLPKKDKDNDKEKDISGGGDKKAEGKPEKKPDEKNSKEPPVTTAVMKVTLHCQGCIDRIRKAVTKTTGYHDMSVDVQKNLVTVKGTMDMKALAETLKEKFKRPVEIVPPKKDGGENKVKEGSGGEKGKGGGGGGKGKGGGEEGQAASGVGGGSGGVQVEQSQIQHVQYGYPNTYIYGYEFGYPAVHPPPQIFSDENPNACSVM